VNAPRVSTVFLLIARNQSLHLILWQRRTGKVFRDPDRAIRKLSQEGKLIKIAKGIYRYDPDFIQQKNLEDFTPQQKAEIMKREGYKCLECGRGTKDGVELMVDNVKPKDLGGKSTIDNGETLCAQHNFIKKNYSQCEAGMREKVIITIK
jgi:5-methylcytosine-specific restriction endonuclease McrA